MALFTWSNEYSVEVQSIDKQHQKLFDIVNELHDAMKAGKGSQLTPEIVKRLAEYAWEHFAHEEDMMKRANYPDFSNHKAEHDKLKGEVARMASGIRGGNAILTMHLQEFLCNWLQSHILQRDMKYSAPLRAAGIRLKVHV